MATNLDLEEQEQLDKLKHFWRAYGVMITWVLIIALLGWGGWLLWQTRQTSQAQEAAAMFVEIEQVVRAKDPDRAGTWFSEMQQRFPGTLYTAQAGLLTAKAQSDKGQLDAARTSLQWVADHASDPSYRAVARLRLAGMLLDAHKPDEVVKLLDYAWPTGFTALAEDRRGDALMAQGKRAEAIAAYQRAYAGLDPELDYRRLVEGKLTALGAMASAVVPGASAPAAGAASAAQGSARTAAAAASSGSASSSSAASAPASGASQ